ncbi:hypothetical protein [Halomicrobium mukohataei]|nr:hypothetical protein [Halomicrobium mukohataei]
MRLDTLMGYGLVGTIGVSASTVASAVVGKPFPVVVPTVCAAAVVAVHHVKTKHTDDQLNDGEATDTETSTIVTDGGDR